MLNKNTRLGKMAAEVEKLGWVPFCVADAFSWLTHAYGQMGRGKNKRIVWEWVARGESVPSLPEWNGRRCSGCIFHEPEWSQKYPMCAHSWCHDDDGDCQAFYPVEEFLEQNPAYAEFCRPPKIFEADYLLDVPYREDGTTYRDFRPCCRFPSHYYARLNMTKWYQDQAVQNLYAAVENERLRRFRQHLAAESIQQKGGFQMDMFLDLNLY